MAVPGTCAAYSRAEELLTQYPEDYNFGIKPVTVSLHSSAYRPNTSHAYDSDLTGEVSGGNYSRKKLQGRGVLFDEATGRIQLAAARVVWPTSSIVARWAVIRFPAVGGAPNLLCYVDFGQELRSNNSSFIVSWDQGRVLEIEGAS